MADHALEYQPNRTTRDSMIQDTAHLSHLQEAMYISHPTQQRGDIFIFGNSEELEEHISQLQLRQQQLPDQAIALGIYGAMTM
eukprot:COSAG05_NODE_642_length_8135_cov_20.343703_9_plen_82_part_01